MEVRVLGNKLNCFELAQLKVTRDKFAEEFWETCE